MIFLSRTHGNNNYNRKSKKLNSSSVQRNTIKKTNPTSNPKTPSTMQTIKPTRVTRRGNLSNIPPTNSQSSQNKPKINPPSNPKPTNPLNRTIIYLFRVGILGIGLAAIVGTVLANIDLTKPLFPNINLPLLQTSKTGKVQAEIQSSSSANLPKLSPIAPKSETTNTFVLKQRLTSLEQKFATLKVKYTNLEPGAFFIDLDNNAYVDFNGNTTFAAASTIKIPILVAFFEDVDAGKIYLDEELIADKTVIATGSGNMQYNGIDKKYTSLYTVTEMIVNSDNTATNMIIRRLGGIAELNKRFKSYGLQVTEIRNPLPDLEGTNTTSPRDLAYLLTRINNGELVSLKSRDRILGIMQKTKTKTLLPKGLEEDAVIAHKTGDIGTILGDAGIVDMPTGKRYIGAVMVKRSHNDETARTLIQEISTTAYQHFKWYNKHTSVSQPVKK